MSNLSPDHQLIEARHYAAHLKDKGVAGFTVVQDLITRIESQAHQIAELELTIKAMNNADMTARDLAELRPCYSFDGLAAFVAKHFPRFELRQQSETPKALAPFEWAEVSDLTTENVYECKCHRCESRFYARGKYHVACDKCRAKRHIATLEAQQPVPPNTDRIPEILYDGYAVFRELNGKARQRTSAENVSDVLDAIVRVMRGKPLDAKGRTVPEPSACQHEFYPFDSMGNRACSLCNAPEPGAGQ